MFLNIHVMSIANKNFQITSKALLQIASRAAKKVYSIQLTITPLARTQTSHRPLAIKIIWMVQNCKTQYNFPSQSSTKWSFSYVAGDQPSPVAADPEIRITERGTTAVLHTQKNKVITYTHSSPLSKRTNVHPSKPANGHRIDTPELCSGHTLTVRGPGLDAYSVMSAF